MKTIAENLQILKNSTDAIKLAIIDKGGDVSGDISTWAEAISGIESDSSEGNSVDFYCNFSYSGTTLNVNGYFSNSDFLSQYNGYCRLVMGFYNDVTVLSGFTMVRTNNYNNISLSIIDAVDGQIGETYPLNALFNMYAVIMPITLGSDQGILRVNLYQMTGSGL